MDLSTPGRRLYAIRLQYGDGSRKAEPLKAFAKRVEDITGEHYDPMTLSLLERDEQGWKLIDAEILSQLDKERRGKEWLAFGPAVNDAAEPKRKAR